MQTGGRVLSIKFNRRIKRSEMFENFIVILSQNEIARVLGYQDKDKPIVWRKYWIKKKFF
jgi:hypothetical protein